MNRKAETFFDAITLLREDLVEEAQNYVFRKKRNGWRKFGSLAACMVLVVSLGILAVMPKGCGGGAPPFADMNSSGAAPASPAEMPPSADGDVPYGGGAASGEGSEDAPRLPEGEGEPDIGGLAQFNAQVLEVLEDSLLVKPVSEQSFLEGVEQVYVSLDGLEEVPELQTGDMVTIVCGRILREDGAVVVEYVTEVRLAE